MIRCLRFEVQCQRSSTKKKESYCRPQYGETEKRQYSCNAHNVDSWADTAKSCNDRQQRRPALPTYIYQSR